MWRKRTGGGGLEGTSDTSISTKLARDPTWGRSREARGQGGAEEQDTSGTWTRLSEVPLATPKALLQPWENFSAWVSGETCWGQGGKGRGNWCLGWNVTPPQSQEEGGLPHVGFYLLCPSGELKP